MRKNLSRVLLGLFVLALAVVAVGRAFSLWDIDVFDGWWTLFLIIPALASMISSRPNLGNIFLLSLGLWLWARCQSWIDITRFNVDYLALAVFLVLAALWLIFGRNRREYNVNVDYSSNDNNIEYVGNVSDNANSTPNSDFPYEEKPNYLAIFNTTIASNKSNNLKKAEVVSVFGRAEIDFSQARLASQTVKINLVSVFGGIDIVPPENVNVQTTGVPIFGNCNKIRNFPMTDGNLPTLVIEYVSIFGGIRIK